VTLGGAGCIAVTATEGWRVPVLPIRPVDTTGAGDAFVGVLTAWLDGGAGLVEALRAASVGAACTCEQVGAQTAQPARAEILERLAGLPPVTPL
jgi:ribokinase